MDLRLPIWSIGALLIVGAVAFTSYGQAEPRGATMAYVEMPGCPVMLWLATGEGVDSDLGAYAAGAGDFIVEVQRANAYWLPAHAKSGAYHLSYVASQLPRFRQSEDSGATSTDFLVAGRYDRPFMSTPISEFVIYGGVLGVPSRYTYGLPSNPEAGWIADEYTISGVIEGREAAMITPFVYWPLKLNGKATPEDYRDVLSCLGEVRSSIIAYEIKVDAVTHVINSERFVVRSEDLARAKDNLGEYRVEYKYEYNDVPPYYPTVIHGQAVALPISLTPALWRNDEMDSLGRLSAEMHGSVASFEVKADVVDGLWIPFYVKQESSLENGMVVGVSFAASQIAVTKPAPDKLRSSKWIPLLKQR